MLSGTVQPTVQQGEGELQLLSVCMQLCMWHLHPVPCPVLLDTAKGLFPATVVLILGILFPQPPPFLLMLRAGQFVFLYSGFAKILNHLNILHLNSYLNSFWKWAKSKADSLSRGELLPHRF